MMKLCFMMRKTELFCSNFRYKSRMSTFDNIIQHSTEVLDIQIGKEEEKLYLIMDGMNYYVENPIFQTKTLRANKKLSRYKI